MSSALSRLRSTLGLAARGVLWTVLLAIMAAGAAGMVGQSFHAPGSTARAELTYGGDMALGAQLDAATDRLQAISDGVDQLADEAKTALEEVSSSDPDRLETSLQTGSQIAATIDVQAEQLRTSLAELPGGGPDAVLEYSNATLVRRAAVIAAADAGSHLLGQWQTITESSGDAAHLTTLIGDHDTTILDAAAKGRARDYQRAIVTIAQASSILDEIQALRVKLIAGTDDTVLDEWIRRNRTYDAALRGLYEALVKSNGANTVAVQAALRAEKAARDQLPPDRRTILLIVSEVARGGLTQAVVAIDDARAHIEAALGGS